MKSKLFSGMILLSATMIIAAIWWDVFGEITPISLGATGGIMFVVTVIIGLAEIAD